MAELITVPGTCTVSFDGSDVGISVDGVEMEIETLVEEVYTDQYGPLMPADVQYFGARALIRVEFIQYDPAVLAPFLSSFDGVSEGTIGTIGKLYFAQNGIHEVVLQVSHVTSGTYSYTFPGCYAFNSTKTKLGVKRQTWNLEIRAFSVAGGILYTKA